MKNQMWSTPELTVYGDVEKITAQRMVIDCPDGSGKGEGSLDDVFNPSTGLTGSCRF